MAHGAIKIEDPREVHYGRVCESLRKIRSIPKERIGILRAVNEQETVDRLAALATPRLASLLRLRSVRHVYDPTPGALNSKAVEDGNEFTLDKLKRASQPYRDIERFLSDEKVMEYIVGPGLLPIVTALSKDILGKKVLVTRRMATRD